MRVQEVEDPEDHVSPVKWKVSLSSNSTAWLDQSHLSDFSSLSDRLRKRIKAGTVLPEVVVLQAEGAKRSVVSCKPSMVAAAKAKTLPTKASQIQSQQLVHGWVKNVTASSVFVATTVRCNGLAPRSAVADAFVEDATALFKIGQSIVGVVTHVDPKEQRFQLSLKPSAARAVPEEIMANYFKQLDRFAIAQDAVDWKSVRIGSVMDGTIDVVKKYGVVLTLPADLTGFASVDQVKGVTCTAGANVRCRVLDIDAEKSIIDVSLRPEIVLDDKLSSKGESQKLKVGQKVDCVVELTKEDYIVVSVTKYQHRIAFVMSRHFNEHTTAEKDKLRIGQKLQLIVKHIPSAKDQLPHRPILAFPDVAVKPRTRERDPDSDSTVGKFKDGDIRSISELEVGMQVKAKILSIGETQMNVVMGPEARGRIHITSVFDADHNTDANPFDSFKVGQVMKVKAIGFNHNSASNVRTAELTVRPTLMELDQSAPLPPMVDLESVRKGQVLSGYVVKVEAEGLWVAITPNVKGRVFILDVCDDVSILSDLGAHFKIGQPVRAVVTSFDSKSSRLDLSLKIVPDASKKKKKVATAVATAEFSAGQIIVARISKILGGQGGLYLQLDSRRFGRVHITDISDTFADDPTKDFTVGQFVRAYVLEVDHAQQRTDLSLRPSRVDGRCDTEQVEIVDVSHVVVGQLIRGYVKTCGAKGCFVSLNRHIEGRVKLNELADGFVDEPSKDFPPGKLVAARVLSVDEQAQKVELSMKRSTVFSTKRVIFEELQVGQVVRGEVHKVEAFGVFIRIQDSELVGLCHKSEVADTFVKQVESMFRKGDRVKAIILRLSAETKRISLGMKESYFESKDEDSEDEGDDENEDGEPRAKRPKAVHSKVVGDSDNDDDDEGAAEDEDEDDEEGSDVDGADSDGEEELREFERDLDDIAGSNVVAVDMSDGETLGDIGFTWDEGVKQKRVRNSADSDNESEEDEDVHDATQSKQQAKRQKAKKRKVHEERLANEEEGLLLGKAPGSVDEYERLLVTTPNSSFVWIQYMAFRLSLAEVDKARETAQRALKAIDVREERERLNVWAAWMNLERTYGVPETLSKVFQDACQANEPKKVYYALVNIFEKGNDDSKADDTYKTMTRKFKLSSKVWCNYGLFKLQRSKADAARGILEKALGSLPRRKHLKTICKFAVAEMKHGSIERGRTMFEGIISNYPKRIDLWAVYIDLEVKSGNISEARSLHERAVNLKLNARKMRHVFKRAVQFEKQYGNAEQVGALVSKAKRYVSEAVAAD